MGKSGFHVDTPAHYLEHSIPSSNSMKDGIEVCAGIGALGEGMTANGIKVHVANDIRESFTSLMRFQGFETTVTGDVGSHAVWAEIHAAHPTRAVLGAGFPCQPWSRLGDQKNPLMSEH
jgi:site-specific DNA-cytosine methylase